MVRFLICAAPVLLVAAPGFAQQTTTSTTTAAPAATAAPAVAAPSAATASPVAVPAAAPEKPKKVCRTYQETGQRIAKSKCYTKEQWADIDRTNEAAGKQTVDSITSFAARGNLQSGGDGSLSTNSMFGFGPTPAIQPGVQ